MRTKSFFSIFTVLAIVLIACSSGKRVPSSSSERWQKLGEKRVDYRIDHDILNVTRRDGIFKQLRFVVKSGSLNMHKCVIHFENGGMQEVDFRHSFSKGSSSRIIDLRGNRRLIENISFWYDTKNFSNSKAIVVVWGK
jgi:hypothetical protein